MTEKRKAGRPKAEPTAVIRLRVPVAAHAAIIDLGGDKWARRIILAALAAHQKSRIGAEVSGLSAAESNTLNNCNKVCRE